MALIPKPEKKERSKNAFNIQGAVSQVDASYTPGGIPKASVTVWQLQQWEDDKGPHEKNVYVTVQFFGKPAQEVIDSDVAAGDEVAIFGTLGSYASNKPEHNGRHFTTINGIVLTIKAKGQEIPMGDRKTEATATSGTEIP